MDTAAVLDLFEKAPRSARLHVQGRWRTFPFPRLSRWLPERGLLIDLGCGHGLWSFYQALQRPNAQVLGVDPDARRIELANQLATRQQLSNLRFETGYAQQVDLPPCDLVSLVDVAYLLPFTEQTRLVERVFSALNPGGVLLLKEMSATPRWKWAWNWFEEILAVRVLHITHGRRLYLRDEADWLPVLNALDGALTTERLDAGYPYPHILYALQKPL